MRAIALTETPDHVCGRYRVRAFEPALNHAGWSLAIEGIAKGVVDRLRQLRRCRDYDAVVLQRKLLPGWQIALLRRSARRLIFDFDDAVLYRDSYDPRGPFCRRRASRFKQIVQIADLVIAGNGFLAEAAERSGARSGQVRVIPTCIATDRYPVEEERPGRSELDLTWIGSGSTLAGLVSRKDVWERVGREVPGVRLRLICDRPADLGPMAVVPVPWSEATEGGELAKADAGVSWVPDDLWSRGKCGLKVLQYQAAGLPAVANPVGVHPEMIEPGRTGFLPETAGDWVDAIRWLKEHPEERTRMGREARRSVEERYSVGAWSPTFVGAIAGCAAAPSPKYRGVSPQAQAAPTAGAKQVDPQSRA